MEKDSEGRMSLRSISVSVSGREMSWVNTGSLVVERPTERSDSSWRFGQVEFLGRCLGG